MAYALHGPFVAAGCRVVPPGIGSAVAGRAAMTRSSNRPVSERAVPRESAPFSLRLSLTPDGTIQRATMTARDGLGDGPDRMVGCSLQDIVVDGPEHVREILRSAAQARRGEPVLSSLVLRDVGGAVCRCIVRVRALREPTDGRPVRYEFEVHPARSRMHPGVGTPLDPAPGGPA